MGTGGHGCVHRPASLSRGLAPQMVLPGGPPSPALGRLRSRCGGSASARAHLWLAALLVGPHGVESSSGVSSSSLRGPRSRAHRKLRLLRAPPQAITRVGPQRAAGRTQRSTREGGRCVCCVWCALQARSAHICTWSLVTHPLSLKRPLCDALLEPLCRRQARPSPQFEPTWV